jgi:hypothetical protein
MRSSLPRSTGNALDKQFVNGIMRDGEKENLIWATAGITFLLVLTESGKGLFVVTSYQKGFYSQECHCSVVVWKCGKRAAGEGDNWGTDNDGKQDGLRH